ncbi:HU family DNA-binding protein, partial [Inquilinus sp.]
FGGFKGAIRPAREGRNPTTGAPITIAASKKVVFSPSKPVREALNA